MFFAMSRSFCTDIITRVLADPSFLRGSAVSEKWTHVCPVHGEEPCSAERTLETKIHMCPSSYSPTSALTWEGPSTCVVLEEEPEQE